MLIFPWAFWLCQLGACTWVDSSELKVTSWGLARDTVNLVFFRLHIGNNFKTLSSSQHWQQEGVHGQITHRRLPVPQASQHCPRAGAATPTKAVVKSPPTNSSIKASVEGGRYYHGGGCSHDQATGDNLSHWLKYPQIPHLYTKGWPYSHNFILPVWMWFVEPI